MVIDILLMSILAIVIIFTIIYLRKEGFVDYKDNNILFLKKNENRICWCL